MDLLVSKFTSNRTVRPFDLRRQVLDFTNAGRSPVRQTIVLQPKLTRADISGCAPSISATELCLCCKAGVTCATLRWAGSETKRDPKQGRRLAVDGSRPPSTAHFSTREDRGDSANRRALNFVTDREQRTAGKLFEGRINYPTCPSVADALRTGGGCPLAADGVVGARVVGQARSGRRGTALAARHTARARPTTPM